MSDRFYQMAEQMIPVNAFGLGSIEIVASALRQAYAEGRDALAQELEEWTSKLVAMRDERDALSRECLVLREAAMIDPSKRRADKYLSALNAEAIADAKTWSYVGFPGDVLIGGIMFRVTRNESGELVAEEVPQ